MYFIKNSRWHYLAGIGLLFLMVAGFLFPFVFPGMGIVATSILFSLGAISLGFSLSYIFYRIYKSFIKPPKIIKNKERIIVDELLVTAEEQKKKIENLTEKLLIERHRHERLEKESKELDSQLLAVQSASDNPNPDVTDQSIDSESNEHSPLLKKPSGLLVTSFSSEPLFQASVDRGKEATVSNVEEIQREINENLTVLEEAAAQLKQDQVAAMAAELKQGQDKKNS